MEKLIKQFNELTTRQLFDIYKLRSVVFVVEQNCPYQDVDDKDLEAYHVMFYEKNDLVAYSRILPPGHSYSAPRIGRVVVSPDLRKADNGTKLMQFCLAKTNELFKDQEIVISAQTYLLNFYTGLGFKAEGEEYLEDDIPHVKMKLSAGYKKV